MIILLTLFSGIQLFLLLILKILNNLILFFFHDQVFQLSCFSLKVSQDINTEKLKEQNHIKEQVVTNTDKIYNTSS